MANFPLFLISFAIYNMIAFLTPGVTWSDRLFALPMYSGANWEVTLGDALIGLSLVFLLFGVYRTVRISVRRLGDRLLAGFVFLAALAEFILVREAATSIFAIVLAIAFVDLLSDWLGASRAPARVPAAAAPQTAAAEPAPATASESPRDLTVEKAAEPTAEEPPEPAPEPSPERTAEPESEPVPAPSTEPARESEASEAPPVSDDTERRP